MRFRRKYDVWKHRGIWALAFVLLSGQAAAPAAQEPDAATEFRLLRSVSGTTGREVGGRYEIDAPRAAFTTPSDRQIVVFFEWETRPGRYRFDGRWKDPSGKVALTAPVEKEVRGRRLGLYWTLGLPERTASGLWALEVVTAGTVIGTHAFEIRPDPGTEPLSPAAIYARAQQSVGLVEALAAHGEVLEVGVVAALDADLVIAPFRVVDGASSLRIRVSGGRALEVRELGSWSRREGWTILRAPGHGLSVLPPATRKVGVGDRVYVIDSTDDGSRVIAESSIVGQSVVPGSIPVPRLHRAFALASPVVNEHGELTGFVTGRGGEPTLGAVGIRFSRALPVLPRAELLLPREYLPSRPAAQLTSLAEMAAAGHFVKPLSRDQSEVISGVFASRVERGGAVPNPIDQRAVFSRRDGSASVFVQWRPTRKRDAVAGFEIYDAENNVLVRGTPSPLKLRAGELFFSTWIFDLAGLPPGNYRVDLLLDGEPIWRGYLRLTD